MIIDKTTLREEERALIKKLSDVMDGIQEDIDALCMSVNDHSRPLGYILEIRGDIRGLRDKLVPLAEMKAGLASSRSRDKYFPDLSKNAFIEYVKGEI